MSLATIGVPDAIAYLTEDEILAAVPDLEELGFPKHEIQELLAGQSLTSPTIDYYRFSLVA